MLLRSLTLLLLLLAFTCNPFSMSAQTDSPEKPRLIYVYDALCGWCYGFSPVIHGVYDDYQDQLYFQVVSGGMMMGERAGPIGEVAPFIKDAYKTVENHTGIKFGQPFLDRFEEGSMVFRSLQPAIAMAVFRETQADRAIEFAHTLQKAVYFDGMPPDDSAAYGPYAAEYGFDPDAFVAEMADTAYTRLANIDFQFSQQLGVNGFPTVFLYKDEQLYLLARGYVNDMSLRSTIDQVLSGAVGEK